MAATAEKVPGSRTFRLFVSSTSEDFKAERNALQRYAFPMLAALCASRNARFQAVDLRWGVSEEASLDQRAMPILPDRDRTLPAGHAAPELRHAHRPSREAARSDDPLGRTARQLEGQRPRPGRRHPRYLEPLRLRRHPDPPVTARP